LTAQTQTGSIWGTARNTKGETLSRVEVGASNPDLPEKQRTVLTDDDGRYQFSSLPAGTYRVTFTLQEPYDSAKQVVRYDCAIHDNVMVASGTRTEINPVLKFCEEHKVVVID
jgi:hypothetical protein